MWSRRHFLESLGSLPVVKAFTGTPSSLPAGPAKTAGRDYFRELGRAPLHQRGRHLHGDDRVADAAGSHGGDQLRLEALRDARRAPRPRRRADRDAGARRGGDGDVGRGVGADARDRRRPHRHGPTEDRRSARSRRHEERSHHPEGASLRVRARRPQLRRAAGRGRDARRSRTRGQRQDRDDALLQQQQQGRADPGRGVRPAWSEALDSDAERCGRRRAAGREPVEIHRHGLRPGRVLRRQGHSRTAERRACCSARSRSSPPPVRTARPTATRSAAA